MNKNTLFISEIVSPDGITQKEYYRLVKFYKGFKKVVLNIPSKHTKIQEVIMIVHDTHKKHDSGYPYIRTFGYDNKKKILYDMGWHDHVLLNKDRVNIDVIHSNIYRLANFDEKKQWTIDTSFFGSSLLLRDDGSWH